MRIEHLVAGVLNPVSMPGTPAHVLLVHTDDGLILIDTGFGTADVLDPVTRIGPIRRLLRPELDLRHTLVHQLRERGHTPGDVTHIVLTHLDLDHCGGLSDFPDAQVHTTADEHAAAVTAPDTLDKRRYRPAQLAHGPRFTLHEGRGDEWRFGLTGHQVLPGVTIVPMPGHTRGHAAVAVESATGTVIHAGDATFDASTIGDHSPQGRPLRRLQTVRAFEQVVGRDRRRIRANHRELRRLATLPDVLVVPAHDARISAELVD
ncbi:MBL fold metallo-hydrolase [Aeromicrobium sp. CTD01-1L150]|uniref:MBL fold metallo-hydrolase n=1 Tax=Aeromicrobium sp. CTD01-1L150 TaxID=3341830 RepID=UPI0035BF7FB6